LQRKTQAKKDPKRNSFLQSNRVDCSKSVGKQYGQYQRRKPKPTSHKKQRRSIDEADFLSNKRASPNQRRGKQEHFRSSLT
jgi:hypothetical protein